MPATIHFIVNQAHSPFQAAQQSGLENGAIPAMLHRGYEETYATNIPQKCMTGDPFNLIAQISRYIAFTAAQFPAHADRS